MAEFVLNLWLGGTFMTVKRLTLALNGAVKKYIYVCMYIPAAHFVTVSHFLISRRTKSHPAESASMPHVARAT